MQHVLRSTALLSVIIVLDACGKTDSDGAQSTSPGDAAGSGGSGDTSSSSGGVSIPLTEKRFQAYVAYRKELHGLTRAFAEDMAKFAKTVDAKSGGAEQIATAVQGMRKTEKHDALIQALRKKYGFAEDEDSRLWDAMSEVASAKVIENPSVEPSLERYRKMQEKGGEEKKAADDYFASLEAAEKEGLERARERCGTECVEVLVKHVKEIHDLQLDAVQQMMAPYPAGK
jgi:hypothetical protein